MNREELERQARSALAAAGEMATKGMEWVKNYREAHRESQPDEAVRKIVFELKHGGFSGPPLPEQALNEMVVAIRQMLVAVGT